MDNSKDKVDSAEDLNSTVAKADDTNVAVDLEEGSKAPAKSNENDESNIEAEDKSEEASVTASTDIEVDEADILVEEIEGSSSKDQSVAPAEEKRIREGSDSSSNDLSKIRPRWYILHVYSGQEQKVIDSIKDASVTSGYGDCFSGFLIPAHNTTEVRRGKKVDVVQKFFPGYLLIKMKMSDETRHFVKKQLKVTDFLLNNNKPQAISEQEAMRMTELAASGSVKSDKEMVYEVGERVKVIDGPFVSFDGFVEQVDLKRERLRVTVSIFGRATPVDLEYTQVEKM